MIVDHHVGLFARGATFDVVKLMEYIELYAELILIRNFGGPA
jgi:hypothetical protein